MKKKNLLAVTLCVLLAFSLAACGGDSGGGDDPSDREEILVGYAGPLTGPMSIFMAPTPWVEELCLDYINNTLGGIEVGGQKLPLRIIYADNESDPNKAIEAATKLVTEDNVDILIGGWTPVGTNTTSAVGERYGVPTFVFGAPEESWLEGGPYEWSLGMTFNYDLMAIDVLNMWDKVDTNKVVGYVFDTDVDGTVGRDVYTRLLEGTGYEIFDPGPYTIGTADFTSMISRLKDANVEIICADMITPDFALFWKQCAQYDYVPKVCTINKGMHYEADAAGLEGAGGVGLTFSALWDKNYPFASSLLGMTCVEIADMWEAEHGAFYPYSIGYDVAMYDILYDVFSRTEDLSREAIMDSFLSINIDTTFGNLTFNDRRNMRVPGIGTQWIAGDKFALDKVIVASESFPSVPEAATPIVIPGTTMD